MLDVIFHIQLVNWFILVQSCSEHHGITRQRAGQRGVIVALWDVATTEGLGPSDLFPVVFLMGEVLISQGFMN